MTIESADGALLRRLQKALGRVGGTREADALSTPAREATTRGTQVRECTFIPLTQDTGDPDAGAPERQATNFLGR